MGRLRAAAAAAHAGTELAVVVDVDRDRAREAAERWSVEWCADWRPLAERANVEILAVCAPPAIGTQVALAGLASGKHVLLEKPMGRSLAEARELTQAARRARRVLKIGFNHRYHPGIRRACEACRAGEIGRLVNVRCRYGHGGRLGLEREWRANPELAGGGELIDQGVHAADLIYWLNGLPARATGFLQTAVWPVAPLEDNAFALFQYDDGAVASLHVSMTQWKNLFSLEITGERGAVVVEGLGGSYGVERLVRVRRRLEGGVPETDEQVFSDADDSWALEWCEFVQAVTDGAPYMGTPEDGVAVMRMVDAVYRAAAERQVVDV